MMEKAHKKLMVWKKAIVFTQELYKETKNLPKSELFGLTSQMRRTAVSIPSNIAEGAARHSNKEGLHFFDIARGSISELDTQLIICRKLKLLKPFAVSRLTSTLEKVDSLLSGLIKYRKRNESLRHIK